MDHAKETLSLLSFIDQDLMNLGKMGHRMLRVKETFFKIADYAATSTQQVSNRRSVS